MSISDPIADFLTCIRNGCKVHKDSVTMVSSKLKERIADILKAEGYIRDYAVLSEGAKKLITIKLKYKKNGSSRIQNLEKVSKPGLRRYTKGDEIPKVLNGLGVMIVSTSKGVVTGKEARQQNVGGEMICKVW